MAKSGKSSKKSKPGKKAAKKALKGDEKGTEKDGRRLHRAQEISQESEKEALEGRGEGQNGQIDQARHVGGPLGPGPRAKRMVVKVKKKITPAGQDSQSDDRRRPRDGFDEEQRAFRRGFNEFGFGNGNANGCNDRRSHCRGDRSRLDANPRPGFVGIFVA